MIELHQYCPEQKQWQISDFQALHYPLLSDTKIWINLTAANQMEQRQVLEFFRIHPVISEDFLRERHPPKMEFSDSFSLLILRGFSGPDFSEYLGHSQISVLFNDQVILVKYHSQQDDSKIDLPFSAMQGIDKFKDWIKKYIHAVSGTYLEKLLQFEDELGELEDSMQTNGNDQKMAQIMKYRSVFRKIDRNLAYQKEMFSDLLYEEDASHPFKRHFDSIELRDFYEKFERLHSMTQMYYDQLSDLVGSYISTSSHQINEKMKVLTMLSAVFIPLTFIVGVYGMNFKYMPELDNPSGYYITWGLMLVLALGLLAYFKIRRWW